VYRIGLILSGTPEEVEHLTRVLGEGLRDLGYMES
jgi:hypothetical protein